MIPVKAARVLVLARSGVPAGNRARSWINTIVDRLAADPRQCLSSRQAHVNTTTPEVICLAFLLARPIWCRAVTLIKSTSGQKAV